MSDIIRQVGTISHISAPENGQSNGKPWTKQTVVIDVNVTTKDGNSFERKVAAEAFNKDLSNFRVGQKGTLSLIISAREYNGTWYTNPKFIGFDPEQGQTASQTQAAPQKESANDANDNLPF